MKAKFGGLEVSDVAKIKSLEDENNRLRRIVADQALNVDVLNVYNPEILTPAQKRRVVQAAREQFGISERQAHRYRAQTQNERREEHPGSEVFEEDGKIAEARLELLLIFKQRRNFDGGQHDEEYAHRDRAMPFSSIGHDPRNRDGEIRAGCRDYEHQRPVRNVEGVIERRKDLRRIEQQMVSGSAAVI